MTYTMKVIQNTLFLTLLLAIANCSASTNKLSANPTDIEQIGLFANGKVIAIEKTSSYFIGETRGVWSEKYQLKTLGLEFVDFTLTSNDGVYLMGGTTLKNKEGIILTKGRTVLLDTSNKVIEQWDYDANFNSAVMSKGDLIGSTGNNIYRLEHNGKKSLIHKRTRSTLISIVKDNKDKIIICNPYALRKSNTPFLKYGCFKENEWEFEGEWYSSTLTVHTEPKSCGKWLVEPVQKEFNKSITGIKVRDLKTGILIHEREVTDTNRFLCINNKSIMLGSSLASYSLPDLKPAEAYSCHNNEPVKSIMQSGKIATCLTEQGNIGKLVTVKKKLAGSPMER